jgi:hypothetical protein
MKNAFVPGYVLAVLCAGCGSTTAPSSTSSSNSSPVSETFASQIFAQGSAFRTFTASQAGTVTVRLLGGPLGMTLGLGLGLPGETAGHCQLTFVIDASPDGATVVSSAVDPGSYCAGVFDVGGIPASTAVAFSIRIDHP